MREPQGPEDTVEKLEAVLKEAQEFIDTGEYFFSHDLKELTNTMNPAEPLTEEEVAQKETNTEEVFTDWSQCDFQQFVRALEAYSWCVYCIVHHRYHNAGWIIMTCWQPIFKGSEALLHSLQKEMETTCRLILYSC